MIPSQRRKASINRCPSGVRSETPGVYIGSTRSGPAIIIVSAPSAAAARKLTPRARSVVEAERGVPPIPRISGQGVLGMLPRRVGPLPSILKLMSMHPTRALVRLFNARSIDGDVRRIKRSA